MRVRVYFLLQREEQNKQVFRRLIEEGFSKGNLEVLNDVFAPNLKLTIEEIMVSGEETWARITAQGTHRGPFMGRLATEPTFALTSSYSGKEKRNRWARG